MLRANPCAETVQRVTKIQENVARGFVTQLGAAHRSTITQRTNLASFYAMSGKVTRLG